MSRKKYPFRQIFLNMGERIRKVRGKLTQIEFAKLFGVNQNTISRWEKGSLPDEDTLKRIASIGGVTLDWLLRDVQAAPETQLREFIPETYDTRPAVLNLEHLGRALLLTRQFLKKERRRFRFSEVQEVELTSYVYEYLEEKRADPGDIVLGRLADLINRRSV